MRRETGVKRNAQLLLCLLLECVLGDRLESLLHIDGFLCRGLKVRDVALGLAPRHCPLLRHLLIEHTMNVPTQHEHRLSGT